MTARSAASARRTSRRRGSVAALLLAAALGVTAVLAVLTGAVTDRPSPGTGHQHAWAAAAWNSTGEPPTDPVHIGG